MAFDAAGVQFHKALGHTETYPETTARPIESGIGLKRHLEQLRQELAGDGNERGCQRVFPRYTNGAGAASVCAKYDLQSYKLITFALRRLYFS